jgi:hypothetical protein
LSKIAFFDDRGDEKGQLHFKQSSFEYRLHTVFGVLQKFLKAICLKRPEMVSGEWMFHWDYASVHTAQIV